MKFLIYILLSAVLAGCIQGDATDGSKVDYYLTEAQMAQGQGEYLKADKIYKSAIAEFESTLETKPQYKDYFLAMSYYSRFKKSQGQLKEAKAILKKCLSINKDIHDGFALSALIELSDICSEMEQNEEAMQHLKRALSLAKKDNVRNVMIPVVEKRLEKIKEKLKK